MSDDDGRRDNAEERRISFADGIRLGFGFSLGTVMFWVFVVALFVLFGGTLPGLYRMIFG